MTDRLYVVYDSRANYDTDEATVYVTCDTLYEAREYVRNDFSDGVIFSYEKEETTQTLIDERRESSK